MKEGPRNDRNGGKAMRRLQIRKRGQTHRKWKLKVGKGFNGAFVQSYSSHSDDCRDFIPNFLNDFARSDVVLDGLSQSYIPHSPLIERALETRKEDRHLTFIFLNKRILHSKLSKALHVSLQKHTTQAGTHAQTLDVISPCLNFKFPLMLRNLCSFFFEAAATLKKCLAFLLCKCFGNTPITLCHPSYSSFAWN